MKYNFIEIGTSNFGTIIQNCPLEWKGISVEPIKEYLDELPDKPLVRKIQAAIVPDDSTEVELYYIPQDMILEYSLDTYLVGCNKVGEYHPAHIGSGYHHIVEKMIVPAMTLQKLFEDNEVETVLHLKIDTEGMDCDILMHFSHWLETQDKSKFPKKIEFETNSITPKAKADKVIERYCSIGYMLALRQGDITQLFLKK